MPRYYFDVEDDAAFTTDDVGIDCATDEVVKHMAVEALPAMARDVLPDGDQHTIVIHVRDESGTYVFKAMLQLNSGWLR